ncbi:MAG: hypothetical protein ACRELT_00040 [Longimicrobiales bacterium]
MALKPCRECKKDVSTGAVTCPHCGVKDPARAKQISTPAGCLILGVVTIALFAVIDTSTGPGGASDESSLVGQCGYNRSDERLLGPVVAVSGDQVTVQHAELGRTNITYPVISS